MHVRLRCGLLSILTPISLPANEFNVLIVLHGQVSLAVVIKMCVIHEAMNTCEYLKIHYMIGFKCKYMHMNQKCDYSMGVDNSSTELCLQMIHELSST